MTTVKFNAEKTSYEIKVGKTNLELSREDALKLHNALKEELKRTPPLFDVKESKK